MQHKPQFIYSLIPIALLVFGITFIGMEDRQTGSDFKIDQDSDKLVTKNGEPAENTVLITIDDAPRGESTLKILDILDDHDVKALFFLNGYLIEDQREREMLVKEIDQRGHLLGNHTWSHSNLTELDSTETHYEIHRLQELVEDIVGYQPHFFRPPYGEHNTYLWAMIEEFNMQTMNWSAMSFDWNYEDDDEPDEIIELSLQQLHDGANYLFHDRKISASALDRFLTEINELGYDTAIPEHP